MARTLHEYFRNIGRTLPTFFERERMWLNFGLDKKLGEYKRTAEQNIAFLAMLEGRGHKPVSSYTIVTTTDIAEKTDFRIKQPLRGVNAFSVIQGFGQNAVPFYKQWGYKGHNGIDMRATTGTPTVAVCDGQVIFAGIDGDGGIVVEYLTRSIDVAGQEIRLRFVHYHLQKVLVEAGDTVIAGQEISLTDNTGKHTTGPHLHFGCKIQYRIPDNEGGWVQDINNGYRGAVNPEPLFDSFDYQIYPVDTRYGMVTDPHAEAYMFLVRRFVTRKLRRRPTRREEVALAYGHWDIETVMNAAQFYLWAQVTKGQYQGGNIPVVPIL